MSSELRDLYQEVIVDHSKRPRNFKKITDATKDAEGFNPLCGDRLHLYLKIEDGRIVDATFEGQGCAISTASASMMTEILKGKTVDDSKTIFEQFHKLVLDGSEPAENDSKLGKLAVFAGVYEYPARVKCASLPWHTLKSALDNSPEPAKTE